ncbi:stalk domain-containing protein [Natranaerobius trueperi]|uniref:Copper amine oxidase-like N-terminal domain-containing protein n=1 Tax=Natranaerobius trueperi TaxID=759412 RepID=A0A226C2Q5_9FIRM|nr:stalk domain-containing protein [Natranaerobius trueperi]OWZ84670.1 hypothetical protein CDO51_02600 [Natranaerobius trueperi]
MKLIYIVVILLVINFGNTTLASEHWNTIHTEDDLTLNSLIQEDNKLIAVGSDDYRGVIITSNNGTNWSTTTTDITDEFTGIAYNNDIWILVTKKGTIYSSEDLNTWEMQFDENNNRLSDIIWNDDEFIAIGDSGTVLTSQDGTDWETESISSNDLKGIAWNDDKTIVIEKNHNYAEVYILEDEEWERKVIDYEGLTGGYFPILNDITYNEEIEKFVSVGDYGTIFYYDEDDENDKLNWKKVEVADLNDHLYAIASNDEKFIAVGNNSTMVTSYNGRDWSKVGNQGKNHNLYDIVQYRNDFFALRAFNLEPRKSFIVTDQKDETVDVFINDELLAIKDQPAFIDNNNNTVVPLRTISDAFGAKTRWIGSKRLVTIETSEQNTKLYLDQDNSTTITKNNRLVVPLRFVSEKLGATVEWSQKDHAVYIEK